MQFTDPVTVIKSLPPGSAIYGRVGEDMINLETVILIHEEDKYIKMIPENPTVEIRTGIFEAGKVTLICALLKIGNELYETWWNYYQTGNGKVYFDDMEKQDRLVILVFDHTDQRRSIKINNSLRDYFTEYAKVIAIKQPWTMQEFDAERDKVYAKFPSVKNLWDRLGKY